MIKNGEKDSPFLWRAIISILLMSFLVFHCQQKLFYADAVKVTETETEKAYFVLVLDCSGSMNQNDKDGLTRVAAEMFVSMLPKMSASLGVVVFGDDYGSDAYNIGRTDSVSQNRVCIAYPITDTNEEGLLAQSAIDIIESKTKNSKGYSPMGYAFEAAAKMLNDVGAPPNRAAIILISDGQILGQKEDGHNSIGFDTKRGWPIYKDFDSVDNALAIVGSRKWPVYCMELDYKNENAKEVKGYPGVAYYQMREHIPEVIKKELGKENTSRVLKTPGQAYDIFEEIITDFYGGDLKPLPISDDGEFEVEEMTAELTVIVHGDLSNVSNVEICDPDNNYTTVSKDHDGNSTDDMEVTWQEKYASFKFFSPKAGKWVLTVPEQEKAKLTILPIAFRETQLFLESSEVEGKAEAGTTINFVARYGYGDKRYSSDTYYSNHPATLYVNDDPLPMLSTKEGYTCSYTMEKKGSYEFFASVKSEEFQGGEKKTPVLRYSVNREKTVIIKQIPDITIGVLKDSDLISLSDYFSNTDTIKYTIEIDTDARAAGLEYYLTDREELRVKGARKKGNYSVTVRADDEVNQTFNVEVVNKALSKTSEMKDVQILFDAPDERSSFRINWNDYFIDSDYNEANPDELDLLKPFIDVSGYEDSAIQVSIDDSGVVLTATGEGERELHVTVVDASDLTQSLYFKFKVISRSRLWILILLAKVVGVLVAAIFLFFLFNTVGRRIYGKWNISLDNGYEIGEPFDGTSVEIGKYISGKKAVCRLNNLLTELGFEGNFGRTQLKAGGKIGKKVFLTNYDGAETLVVNNGERDVTKKEKIEIMPNSVVYLRMAGGDGITLERTS